MNSFDPMCFLLGLSIGGLLGSVDQQRASVATHIVSTEEAEPLRDQSHLIGFLPNLVDMRTSMPQRGPLLPVPTYEINQP